MSYDNLFWGGKNLAGVIVANHTQWKIKAESLLAVCDVFHPTVDKRFPLGALAEARDGRRWRYCENGGSTLAIALINQSSAGVSGWQNIGQDNGPAAFAVGDKRVTAVVTTTVPAGALIDGYLTVENGTGEGTMYLIKDNKLGVDNDTTGYNIVIDIADTNGIRIVTLASSGTDLTVTKNKNKDVIVETGSGVIVGVNNVAVTGDYFFWAQTRGPCPVKSVTTIGVIGDAVMSSSGSAAILGNATTDVIVGHVMRAAVTLSTALIDLNIE